MATVLATGRHPDRHKRYPSRSEAEQAVATAAVNARWTEEDLWRALVDPANVAGDRVRELRVRQGDVAARRRVAKSYAKAQARVTERPAPGREGAGVSIIGRFSAAIDAASWPGVTGSTDRRVLLAHVAIARRAGGPLHDASQREVSEIAAVGARTVRRARSRLVEGGWIAKGRRRGSPGHAGSWELLVGKAAPGYPTSSHPKEGYVGTSGALGLWRPRTGLGKLAERVYELLGDAPRTAAEIAHALGRARSGGSLRRVLRVLESWGLAARGASRGTWCRGSADPSTVAEEMGAAEAEVGRRAVFAAEREVYRKRLEAQRTRTPGGPDLLREGEP